MRIEFRQLEQLFDHSAETLAVFAGDLDEMPLLIGAELPFFQQQRIEISLQRCQRSAKIVRHIGDELAPEQIDLPQLVHLQHDSTGHLLERRGKAIDFITAARSMIGNAHRHGEVALFDCLHRRCEHAKTPRHRVEEQQRRDQREEHR